jgi:hypothetical protein
MWSGRVAFNYGRERDNSTQIESNKVMVKKQFGSFSLDPIIIIFISSLFQHSFVTTSIHG